MRNAAVSSHNSHNFLKINKVVNFYNYSQFIVPELNNKVINKNNLKPNNLTCSELAQCAMLVPIADLKGLSWFG
tara:strand:+ start:393 stop:614 length:222 start_codon:yes stop_codon:yes gene_type:complete